MQVNDLVKVTAEGHEHFGRAGIVTKHSEGLSAVQLDATPELESVEGQFHDEELQFLGR